MGNTKLLLSDKLKLEFKPSPEKAVESIHLVKKTSDGNVNIGVFALEDWYKVMQQMSELLEAIQKYKDEGDVDFWTEDDTRRHEAKPKPWEVPTYQTRPHSPLFLYKEHCMVNKWDLISYNRYFFCRLQEEDVLTKYLDSNHFHQRRPQTLAEVF